MGGLFTWVLIRKQPNYIMCEEELSYRISLGLPETRVLYRNLPVETLYMLRLKVHNAGSSVIENAKFIIRLNKNIRILGSSGGISPERDSSESSCQIVVKDHEVHVLLDRIFPYTLNQDTVHVDIFSDEEIEVLNTFGSGVLKDGSGWSIKYQPRKPQYIRFLGVWWTAPPTKREGAYLIFTIVNFLALLIATITYLFWRPPTGVFSINSYALQMWFGDPVLWIITGWIVLFLAWAFAMGLHGWSLPIPMPFLGRVIHIKFVRTDRI